MSGVVIRDFQPDDAEGISRLFRQIYGDLYVYPEVYLPSLIRRRNQEGVWRSAIAELDGVIVAHAALLIKPSSPTLAEIALTVASPVVIGRGAGVRVCRHLRDRAQAFGIDKLSALLVCSHVQSQRMANPLGFATTGLLLDYLPSPFVRGARESYVISCLPLVPHPLPAIDWPSSCRAWIEPMVERYGVHTGSPFEGNTALAPDVYRDGELINITLNEANDALVDEVCRLPDQTIKLVKVRMAQDMVPAATQLRQAGYRHTGLMPAPSGGWYWLMQSGFRAERVELVCPIAQRLLDSVRSAAAPRFVSSERAA